MGILGTALITGASSGIGESYARHLAASGYDLVLVARREERLQELAATYTERFGVAVEILKADLLDDADIANVVARIESAENLTMLVNNAGFSVLGFFADTPLQKNLNMVRLHIEVNLRLTYAALPKMREAKYGTIITVASMAGFMAMPNNSVYNATKAFLKLFSESVAHEVKDDNIQMQAICPGFTRTDIFEVAGVDQEYMNRILPPFAWMTPDEVVAESFAALPRKKHVVIPGYFNKMYWMTMMFPPTAWVLKQLMKNAKPAPDA